MSRLKHKPTAEVLHSDLNKKLENLTLGDALVEDNWTAFKDMVYSTTFEHLGSLKQHNQDWFDENDAEITSLIEEKIASKGDSKVIPTQPQRKQLLPISTRKWKAHYVRCGMSSLAKRWMKFRAMLITTIQKVSMMHWNVFMVLSHLDPHCSSVQMEPSSSPIKIKSWRDGLNISALFSTILHQSMMRQFNTYCKFWWIMNLIHHPLLAKLKRPFVSFKWQGTWGWCYTSQSLKVWQTCTAPEAGQHLPVHMAARYCTTRLQGCTCHSFLQEKRKLPTVWQSPWHITPVHKW